MTLVYGSPFIFNERPYFKDSPSGKWRKLAIYYDQEKKDWFKEQTGQWWHTILLEEDSELYLLFKLKFTQ